MGHIIMPTYNLAIWFVWRHLMHDPELVMHSRDPNSMFALRLMDLCRDLAGPDHAGIPWQSHAAVILVVFEIAER